MQIKKFIGDARFYKNVLAISVPIMIQNGITNFVSLLDNIMVGRLGTEPMSGVSIVNQFLFVFNLLIFGAISAAGIFTAQYHGSGDVKGVQHTFRFKLIIVVAASLIGCAVFTLFDDQLINLFLHDGSDMGDLALTLENGKKYLAVMIFGLVPYGISQAYASTIRETGITLPPMIASIAAVATNFVFNLILIFGLLGFPALGVVGAAIATVLSRFVELGILLVWSHSHTKTFAFLKGAYRSLYIPGELVAKVSFKGLPLMLNEFFWAISITLRNQCYSTRGLDVVAAQNISSTVLNLFNVVYLSLGSSVAIILGNLLGANKLDEARDTSRKMLAFSVFCGTVMASLVCAFSGLFPMIYNTSDQIRALASFLMIVAACVMPFDAFANAAYFTLRSGGKVFITLLFDSVFMWAVVMPISFIVAHLTDLSIYWMFPICQGAQTLKVIFGLILLKRGTWVRQLVPSDNKN